MKKKCPLTVWNSALHTHVILNQQFPRKTSLSLLNLILKTQNYSAASKKKMCFRQLKRLESSSVTARHVWRCIPVIPHLKAQAREHWVQDATSSIQGSLLVSSISWKGQRGAVDSYRRGFLATGRVEVALVSTAPLPASLLPSYPPLGLRLSWWVSTAFRGGALYI